MNTIYINGLSCISPQPTFDASFLTGNTAISTSPYHQCQEPIYKQFLNPTAIRRMGRLQKMSLVTAITCLKDAGVTMPDAIITGTGLGSLEDSEDFLTSIIDNTDHSPLPPTSFIQSTHNTISSQIAILLKCTGANYTYTQRHFSFESGLLDSILLLKEESCNTILLHAADEMTPTIYEIIKKLEIWPAPIGEGVCSMLLSNERTPYTYAAIEVFHLHYGIMNTQTTLQWIQDCLSRHDIEMDSIDMIIQGDQSIPLSSLMPEAALAGYKNYTGEYFTAAAFAYWLGAHTLKNKQIPLPCLIKEGTKSSLKKILLYNQMNSKYHSLALLTLPQ